MSEEIDNQVLVIDDDEVFNRTLCRGLTRLGLQCQSAHNSNEAVTALKSSVFSSMVLDLRLGEESGLSLIEPALELQPDIRILVLTGYASLTTAVQAIKQGAFNYLAKPANAEAVLNALQSESSGDLEIEQTPTSLKQLEWEHLQRVLAENDGNISATARQLGMHRRTLQRKLQKKAPPKE
ncbi:MAG: response regulator transcription factor [bacterium]